MALEPSRISLKGKTAIVTGAAAGIGESIATTFARFGATVAVCDRHGEGLENLAQSLSGLGVRVLQATLDVRDEASVRDFVSDVVATAGEIDVLVNNAGGTFRAPFEQVEPKGQDALVAENFGSVTHLIRSAIPHMKSSGGSIINITSIEAHRAGPEFAIYSAMKAAVENLTRSLALELGEWKIRVNCIAPDVIPTPGTGEAFAPTPLARSGHVDDVAGAALYLATPLSDFVTGTTLHVDGGNAAAGGWHREPSGEWVP
jgi:NAD(P)-dependent dehydrogenase (short-subunit alcohol dehydrogenase family)